MSKDRISEAKTVTHCFFLIEGAHILADKLVKYCVNDDILSLKNHLEYMRKRMRLIEDFFQQECKKHEKIKKEML